uniref:Uncharacterized protein n=1 Tax=Panagrellus redivivus TaxID=6233 RepID=A0A7E4ZRB0_PANRE
MWKLCLYPAQNRLESAYKAESVEEAIPFSKSIDLFDTRIAAKMSMPFQNITFETLSRSRASSRASTTSRSSRKSDADAPAYHHHDHHHHNHSPKPVPKVDHETQTPNPTVTPVVQIDHVQD